MDSIDTEPPRFSLVVYILRLLTRFIRRGETPSPHQSNSEDLCAYAATEYSHTPDQLKFIIDHGGAEFFDHKDVFEFGCGFGGNLAYYAANTHAKRLAGLDLHENLPAAFRAFSSKNGIDASRCTIIVGNGRDVALPDGSFDSVFSIDVIEHVQDLEMYLAEAKRILRPGGRALFAFPSIKSLFWHHLDALPWPAIHLVFGYKRLISGLNHERIVRPDKNPFPLIGRIKDTQFRRSMHPDMSGVDKDQFSAKLAQTGFRIVSKELIPVSFNRFKWRNKIVSILWLLSPLREALSAYFCVLVEKDS